MAYDEGLAPRVRELIMDVGEFSEKKIESEAYNKSNDILSCYLTAKISNIFFIL